jgi:hypothetical protein
MAQNDQKDRNALERINMSVALRGHSGIDLKKCPDLTAKKHPAGP